MGFWRKSFFARGYRLVDATDDPPVVRELRNLLFWADSGEMADTDQIQKLFHVDGLQGLIENSQAEIDRLQQEVEAGKDPQQRLSDAKEQLEIANSAHALLEVMTNG